MHTSFEARERVYQWESLRVPTLQICMRLRNRVVYKCQRRGVWTHCQCSEGQKCWITDSINIAMEYGFENVLLRHKDNKIACECFKAISSRILRCAAHNGHIRCVQILLEEYWKAIGGNNNEEKANTVLHDAIHDAAREGHVKVIKTLEKYTHSNLTLISRHEAGKGGHIVIMKLCREWEPPSLERR